MQKIYHLCILFNFVKCCAVIVDMRHLKIQRNLGSCGVKYNLLQKYISCQYLTVVCALSSLLAVFEIETPLILVQLIFLLQQSKICPVFLMALCHDAPAILIIVSPHHYIQS